MVEHEKPYFDQVEKLEFPTEAWAAQEFRKANVFRLAAAHAEEPLRSRLLRRGEEFAERAWRDLFRFESRGVTRALAILMTEGAKDAYFRCAQTRTPHLLRRRFIPSAHRSRSSLRRRASSASCEPCPASSGRSSGCATPSAGSS